jgi:hypothetical protein
MGIGQRPPHPLSPLSQGIQHVAELLEGLGYTQHYEAAKRAGQKSKVKRQMANVKSDGILPFDLCDLHFDLPFDAS